MPYFELKTNISKEKIPVNFVTDTVKILAKVLGKPESYVVVNVVPDQLMSWGGGQSPCGFGHVSSIGKIGVAENKKTSAELSAHIEKYLQIPSDKLYIFFTDSNKANVGYQGTTFHDLL